MTLDEANLQLSQVNSAISELLSGNRRVQYSVGSGGFTRVYRVSETTLDELRTYRKELLDIIASYSPNVSVEGFSKNMTVPLVVSKRFY
jgi:hypothetical protein